MTPREFAIVCHGAQRYGREPYVNHLDAVVRVLLEEGEGSPNILAAAWLHDVLEDTKATPFQLDFYFSPDVRRIVQAVTKPPKAEYNEAEYFARIAAVRGATEVKLADRIANIEACVGDYRTLTKGLLMRYLREAEPFQAALRDGQSLGGMWKRFDLAVERASM